MFYNFFLRWLQDTELRSSVLGNAWLDVAHQNIRFRERGLLELERSIPYLEKLTNYPHTCLHHDIPQGADWLENLILANGIPPASLLRALITIADKVEIKTNTLAIIGPANTLSGGLRWAANEAGGAAGEQVVAAVGVGSTGAPSGWYTDRLIGVVSGLLLFP